MLQVVDPNSEEYKQKQAIETYQALQKAAQWCPVCAGSGSGKTPGFSLLGNASCFTCADVHLALDRAMLAMSTQTAGMVILEGFEGFATAAPELTEDQIASFPEAIQDEIRVSQNKEATDAKGE